jgi:ATP-binding cassette subfamily C protein LapB
MVSAGQLTIGALTAATMLASRAMAPLTTASMLLARLHQARMAYTSLSEIVASPQERPADVAFLAKSELDGNISFEGVSFTYEPDAPAALADVSFTIRPGERVALIGGIGSGKTTALKLMQGLHLASKGRVLIDGCSIGALEPSLLRSSMALLPQDPELFQGTIRSNVTIGDPGAADAEILRAAASVGALDWIGRLPRGFDTPIRERGGGLSGGQKQLVALARAMLRSPKVVLLDEPTSHMDGRTEASVLKALAKTAEGRTLVFVTHRPALLDIATRIIVFEGGKVLLDGPRAVVLEQLKAVTERRVAGLGA